MFCNKCGKEIPEGQTFCEDCTNKFKTNSNEKNKSIKKSIKIALIIILAIISLSVIVAISNMSSSPLNKANNLNSNSSIENKENEQQKHYDFLDNDNSTFKFTEKEFIEEFAKLINRNVNDFSITRRTDGYKSYSYTSSLAEVILIGINTSKLNNKVTDIEFEYTSLVQYVDDESLIYMGDVTMDNINCIIVGIDKKKFNSNGYSEEEIPLLKDKLTKLEDCIKRNEGIKVTGNHGGQGELSTVKVKYSVIQ